MTEHPTGRAEAVGRSRWAQLARRGEQPVAAVPASQPVPARPAEPAAQEHHLGDRLSAYLDGELGHDSRERVQSHLATCPECLAEAEASRAVKQVLHRTAPPGPSDMLMARLLAVAALPDDDQNHPGGPGAQIAPGTFGGSRLTGGSFGRGAGSTFGGGALGAQSPIPGIDPRAQRPEPQPFTGRRAPLAMPRPLAALAEVPALRPAPRGRRLVFAAAGAFSVAAVTLGGVGPLAGSAGSAGDGHRPTTVTPAGGSVVPVTAQLPVDYREDYPAHSTHTPAAPPEQHFLR